MTMVITIATETRMRVGGDLRFLITHDQTDGVYIRGMNLLEKQLLALGDDYKTPVKDRGRADREISDRDSGE